MPDDAAGERLVLVGPGRAGRALLRSWTGAGGDAVVIARDAPAAKRRGLPDWVEVRPPDEARNLAGDFLVLAVPDDAIGAVASALASAACRYSFHLSGALPASALAPLSPASSLGSLHPLRAFTGAPDEIWQDSFVAVEGEESASEAGLRLCRRIGARPRLVAAREKPLYHCAATLAAGGVASLLSLAAGIWEEAGLDPEEGRIELARLAVGASQAVGRQPFAEALTGPVARRDVETVRLHGNALVRRPDLARLYRQLALETLRRTPGRGREEEIARLLEPEESNPGSSADLSAKKPDTSTPKG